MRRWIEPFPPGRDVKKKIGETLKLGALESGECLCVHPWPVLLHLRILELERALVDFHVGRKHLVEPSRHLLILLCVFFFIDG